MRTIWERSPVADIDSQIDYFLTVVRCAGNVLRPHVICIRRSGKADLLAVARVEWYYFNIAFGYRTIARPRLRALVVCFGGIIGASDVKDEDLLIVELRRELDNGEVDMILMRNVDVASTLIETFGTDVTWLRRSHAQPVENRWRAPVRSPGDFLSQRSAKTRAKFRAERRRLEAKYAGGVSIDRLHQLADFERICHTMDQVASKTYQRGVGAAYAGTRLERSLIDAGLRHGWFSVWVLSVDSKPVSFWAGTSFAGTFTVATPGFDPVYAADAVGRIAMVAMVDDLERDAAVRYLDFGHGDAEYKASFGESARQETAVFITSRRPKAILLSLIASAASALNLAGRHLVKQTELGKRLKRAWRRRLARNA